MNRSYRTIWNESLGAWVAASEVNKAKGKRSRQGRTALAVGDAAVQPSEPAPVPPGCGACNGCDGAGKCGAGWRSNGSNCSSSSS